MLLNKMHNKLPSAPVVKVTTKVLSFIFYVLTLCISKSTGQKLVRNPNFETNPKMKLDLTGFNLGKYPFAPV